MRRNSQTTEDPLYTELMAAALAKQGTMAGTTSQPSEAKPGFHRAELQPAQMTEPKPTAAATPQPTGAEAGSDRVKSGPWSPWQPNAPAEKPDYRTFSTTQTGPRGPYPAEIEPIIDRAMRGDQTVLPELKRAFDKYPDWVNWFGDLTEHARQSQLHVIAGNCLLAKEAIVRKLLRPIPSTLDLLKQPIADKNGGGAAAQRDAAPLSSGVPVLN